MSHCIVVGVGALLLLWVDLSLALPQQKPWIPVPVHNNTFWTQLHDMHSKVVQANIVSNKIRLIFLGDSITELWMSSKFGKSVWDRKYAPLAAVNLGIRGDRTENLLWRIENSNLSLLSNPPPKVVVLCIGSNNIGFNNATDDDISKGIATIVAHLRKILPSTKILLLALFPRQTIWHFLRVANINLKIARIDTDYRQDYNISSNSSTGFNSTILGEDGNNLSNETDSNNGKMVRFLDMWTHFAEAMGSVVPEYFLKDKVHLNTQGYDKWAHLMNKTLNVMME